MCFLVLKDLKIEILNIKYYKMHNIYKILKNCN